MTKDSAEGRLPDVIDQTWRSYPQPREGITGVDRAGDPLVSLDDTALLVVDALGTMAMHLRRATLGRVHPTGEAIRDRLTTPQPGDLVVVSDSIGDRDPDTRRRGLGYLLEHRAEWWTSDEEWARAIRDGEVYLTDPRMVERDAWYVQYGPAPVDVCRWVNCEVLALPRPGDRWWTP